MEIMTGPEADGYDLNRKNMGYVGFSLGSNQAPNIVLNPLLSMAKMLIITSQASCQSMAAEIAGTQIPRKNWKIAAYCFHYLNLL